MKYKNVMLAMTVAAVIVVSLTGCGKKTTTEGVTDITDLVTESTTKDMTDRTDSDEPLGDETTQSETLDTVSTGVGYKTYTDSELGFSINYRTDWDVTDTKSDSDSETIKGVIFRATGDSSYLVVRVSEVPDGYTLDDVAETATSVFTDSDAYLKSDTTMVGKFEGITMDYIMGDQEKGHALFTLDEENNLAYIVIASTEAENYATVEQTFDDMLNSFKLVEIRDKTKDSVADDATDLGSLLAEKIEDDESSNKDIESEVVDDSDTNTDTNDANDASDSRSEENNQ